MRLEEGSKAAEDDSRGSDFDSGWCRGQSRDRLPRHRGRRRLWTSVLFIVSSQTFRIFQGRAKLGLPAITDISKALFNNFLP